MAVELEVSLADDGKAVIFAPTRVHAIDVSVLFHDLLGIVTHFHLTHDAHVHGVDLHHVTSICGHVEESVVGRHVARLSQVASVAQGEAAYLFAYTVEFGDIVGPVYGEVEVSVLFYQVLACVTDVFLVLGLVEVMGVGFVREIIKIGDGGVVEPIGTFVQDKAPGGSHLYLGALLHGVPRSVVIFAGREARGECQAAERGVQVVSFLHVHVRLVLGYYIYNVYMRTRWSAWLILPTPFLA